MHEEIKHGLNVGIPAPLPRAEYFVFLFAIQKYENKIDW